MHINYEWILYLFKNNSLAYCVLQLVSFLDHVLFQTFDGIELSTELVLGQIDFAEGAGAYHFLQVEAFKVVAVFNH